ALLPASAALLVGTNLGAIRATYREVTTRRLGLPTLSTSIVAATLASGQFFPAALMAWMASYWRGRYRRKLVASHRELLQELKPHQEEDRADALRRLVLAAAAPSPAPFAVTGHGDAFAGRTVAPVLATAGFGLLVGDLSTALAILRPDYATGPGLGV